LAKLEHRNHRRCGEKANAWEEKEDLNLRFPKVPYFCFENAKTARDAVRVNRIEGELMVSFAIRYLNFGFVSYFPPKRISLWLTVFDIRVFHAIAVSLALAYVIVFMK
jgi:hypothetical protein